MNTNLEKLLMPLVVTTCITECARIALCKCA